MDKNTIIGLLLIAGILFTFTLVTDTEPEEDEKSKTEQVVIKDSLNNAVVLADSVAEVPSVIVPVINLDSVPELIKQDTAKLKNYTDSVQLVNEEILRSAERLKNQDKFGIFTAGSSGVNE